ncbi:hypothetical protein OESDEN_12506 [Oesophagostomum dentatum]|uniref:Protein kinase domain-containing protein n=1 Tax=Oesophagostomum dentatum TaxID=61180 RepID=A0A0B1SQZ5_OESDE|nr:hypothetical protein OESDEN_12506 [Oesophagostomum dentatum]
MFYQDCYLDAGQNIKFRGAWNRLWPTWQEDTFRHAYYWRFVAPETLFYQKSASSSVIWNLGVFMWQLSTKCILPPFFHCRSRQSYLDAVLSGTLSLTGDEKDMDSDDLALLQKAERLPQCIE